MCSPFDGRLDTNYTPTEEERTQLLSIVEDASTTILAIDKEAAQLQEALASVLSRRALHEQRLQKHLSLLSPIRRIPIDILETIFKHIAVGSDPLSTPISRSHPAVLVSHVSRSWRHLALSTPVLWSQIFIRIPGYPDYHLDAEEDDRYRDVLLRWKTVLQRIEETARAWIERSSNHSLRLKLELIMRSSPTYSINRSAYPGLSAIVGMLANVACRWKEVEVSPFLCMPLVPQYHVMGEQDDGPVIVLDSILRLDASHFPMLTSLSFEREKGYLDYIPGLYSKIVDSGIFRAPRLEALHLDELGTEFRNLPTSWAHLTSLCLAGYSSSASAFDGEELRFGHSEVFKILLACPNLTRCRLSNVQPTDSTNQQHLAAPQPFQSERMIDYTGEEPYMKCVARLPRLESLYINAARRSTPKRFLQALDMPRLRRLRLRFTVYGFGCEIYHADALGTMDWIMPFGTQLTSLSIHFTTLDQAVIRDCLEEVPSLERLKITTAGSGMPPSSYIRATPGIVKESSNDLIRALTLSPTTPPTSWLCRALKSFSCVFVDWACEESILVEFIRSRRSAYPGTERIQHVKVTMPTLKKRDVREELERADVDLVDFKLQMDHLSPLPL